MPSAIEDAFAHHTWATLQLFDVCLTLTPEQLETAVPGTYGTIRDTLEHLVGSDAYYLVVTTKGRVEPVDEERMSVEELRATMERDGREWATLLREDPDVDEVLVRRRDDGSETHAPLSIRLAQVIHHGTDHRSQICTALTSLGIEPPPIDVWDYGMTDGRVLDVPPTS
jgi:uncharacterized damage-inducible protein DinB